ncbi:Ubiquitin carboxyl-terminal hydrolase 33 [Actinomortierella ambigua]|uniref:Ubiquitin carboxyl-terminal hydrolase n=1 Tax=Actinomortierella ambigua TaxID=1343610 RepID=A0A9P6PX53_9FUNG|nr:Ubiquitin carboxyl-terminal hydrolase 33 [Actinomortierella ambigua]
MSNNGMPEPAEKGGGGGGSGGGEDDGQGKRSKQDGDSMIQDLDMPGLIGLKNLGNTCYMNAALQALSNTPALTHYFQQCDAFIPEARRIEYARRNNQLLVDSYFRFVEAMWSGKSAIYSPSHLVADVKRVNETFQGYGQQDSQEFLRCLLDKLHDELSYPRREEPIRDSSDSTLVTQMSSSLTLQSSTTNGQPGIHTMQNGKPTNGIGGGGTEANGSHGSNGFTKPSTVPEANGSQSTILVTTATAAAAAATTTLRKLTGSSKKSGNTSSISYTSSRSSSSSRSGTSSENSSMTEAAEITPARMTVPSIISDIFEGTLESRVRCLQCHKDYIKEDNFFDLSIPVDKKSKAIVDEGFGDRGGGGGHGNSNGSGSGSSKEGKEGVFGSLVDSVGGWLNMGSRTIKLQDCLASFCATEELTGEDRYRCTQCDALNDCRKTFRFTRLPNTLCIQLKRFRYDSYFSSKINTYVQFPMEDLDMRPYLKSVDPQELKHTKYDLYAMVRHRGVLGGGHYIGYARHPIDGQWYEYDDTYVTKKSASEISKMEAYILFYRRKMPEREEERARIAKFMTKPLMQIYDKGLLVYISRLWYCRWLHLLNGMVMPIPRNAWNALVEQYGTDGSPVIPMGTLEDESQMACAICEKEEYELDERRKREDADVSEMDSIVIGNGELWFLIGADWLKEWHAFKAGDRPPGPIRNSQFLKDNGQARAGMKRGIDYRGINRRVWRYLHGIYGGGPEFCRAALDLYAPAPNMVANGVAKKAGDLGQQQQQQQQYQQQHQQHHHQHQHQQQPPAGNRRNSRQAVLPPHRQ